MTPPPHKPNPLIISSDNFEKAWVDFGRRVDTGIESVDIQYMRKYEHVVDHLLDRLAGCGWIEEDHGTRMTILEGCRHRLQGLCTLPEKLASVGVTVLPCKSHVFVACRAQGQFYQQKTKDPVNVNFVVVEPVGQVRGLRRH